MTNNKDTCLAKWYKDGLLKLNLGDHFGTLGAVKYEYGINTYLIDAASFHLVSILSSLLNKNFDEIEKRLANEGPDFVREVMNGKVIHLGSEKCTECGQRVRFIYESADSIVVDDVCSEPGGLKPWTIELEIPSGVLVFRNDMREELDPEDKRPGVSINDSFGVKITENYYATCGMFHHFVGNTCPSVYILGERVIVGNLTDYETEELLPEYKGARDIGMICTDLWWFSACDLELFKAKGMKPDSMDSVVKLPGGPGTYISTSYYSTARNHNDIRIYTSIEKK